MAEKKRIKITYSTLSSPDPDVDRLYDAAVAAARSEDPGVLPLYINGRTVATEKTFSKSSPVDLSLNMARGSTANHAEVNRAVAAARAAFPAWRKTAWQERVALLRAAADNISDNIFKISAVLSLEVGKNRLESLGDVEESADLIRYCCDSMEENHGFARDLLNETARNHNRSILKPYGVWGVIAPFNFPAALSAGPVGAALVTGNTVVLKPAPDTPYTSYLIAMAFHDAGLPAGVFNFVSGGDETGKALVANPDVDGITFTGSFDVGMSIIRKFNAEGSFVKPVIAEMGGKNPTIISPQADLDKAAIGVMRSAFGLTGQKCSACSRVFVHNSVRDSFTSKLVALTQEKVTVGDPTRKENYMGPIINKTAYEAYKRYAADVRQAGTVLHGAEVIEENGYYVAPTIVTDIADDHPLWKQEMFAPIVFVRGYEDREEALALANGIELGLTAGFYGEDEEEVNWFLDGIEAGVLYINRPAGATTGAWPGYQSFGGWKGSTGTSKAAGSFYYLPQYMREQSHSLVAYDD